MKKVAVILAGCGVYDGTEVHEAVLTLLALERAQAQVICAAPDIPQLHVVNHLTGQPVPGESRNVLVESARIARGDIIPLSQLKLGEIDAIVVPGGFGTAKNLCDLLIAGAKLQVNPELEKLLLQAHRMGKPIGLICIAPAIAAKVLGAEKVELTIGTDKATAATLESLGAKHIPCKVEDIVVDRRLKVVTTPALMLAQRISELEPGINKLVQTVLEMA